VLGRGKDLACLSKNLFFIAYYTIPPSCVTKKERGGVGRRKEGRKKKGYIEIPIHSKTSHLSGLV